jgi:hypothetical protein
MSSEITSIPFPLSIRHPYPTFTQLLTSTLSVAEFNQSMRDGVPLVANEGPYPNTIIVVVTHIRVKEGQGNAVLTIDGEPRTDLALDPVNQSHDYYKDVFKNLTSPFISLANFGSVSIDNLPGDTMLEIRGYNIRTEHPHYPYMQWRFC